MHKEVHVMRLHSSIGVADFWTTRAKYPYRRFPMVILGYILVILPGRDRNDNFLRPSSMILPPLNFFLLPLKNNSAPAKIKPGHASAMDNQAVFMQSGNIKIQSHLPGTIIARVKDFCQSKKCIISNVEYCPRSKK